MSAVCWFGVQGVCWLAGARLVQLADACCSQPAAYLSLLPSPALACSAPVVEPQSVGTVGTGPNSADIVVTPPALGGPFDHFELTICIAGTSDCFTTQCPAASGATTTCPISTPGCADAAIGCLRADTNYTVSTVAVRPDGQASLVSNTEPFKTTPYTCAPLLPCPPASPPACLPVQLSEQQRRTQPAPALLPPPMAGAPPWWRTPAPTRTAAWPR